MGPCLLLLLQPVRRCLHPFLSSQDAVQLMQASRSTTNSLLPGYCFVDHVFTPSTTAEAKRCFALYEHYGMRILRLCLPEMWDEPLLSWTRQPLLPASLTALELGVSSDSKSLVHAAFEGSAQLHSRAREEIKQDGVDYGEGEFHRLVRPVKQFMSKFKLDITWDVHQYSSGVGTLNRPIPPGALSHGLRFLQFNDAFNQPLQVGSIPDTVEVLQFGRAFNRRLELGQMPASLTHLVFGSSYDQPLRLPGVLPAALRRLYMGTTYNQPIPPGAMPPSLQQLSLGGYYDRPISPGAIPTSVTHLRLSLYFNQPLQPASIPEGIVHLNLGDLFDRPLLPGVLPASLRELVLSMSYNQPLQPGSLPDGLEVLAFHRYAEYSHTLQPCLLPASVRTVSLGVNYEQELVAGGIPSTVRWLRLPACYAGENLRGVLSPATRVVWWTEEEEGDEKYEESREAKVDEEEDNSAVTDMSTVSAAGAEQHG